MFFGKNHSIVTLAVQGFSQETKTHKPSAMCTKEYAEMLSFSLFISYTITAQIPQNFQRCIVTDMKSSKGFVFTFEGFLQKPILKNMTLVLATPFGNEKEELCVIHTVAWFNRWTVEW